MARYQVTLKYDGTDFSGFQRQSDLEETRTVQGEVEKALRKIGWSGNSILAAGRTDSGVHASGQVITFDLEWRHGLDDLLAALNANLPFDTAAGAIRQVRADFHPRYDALSRHYRYCLFCQPVRDPLRERYAWRVFPPIRLERLQQAARLLTGVHDFAAFGTPPRPEGATVREIIRAEWQSQADEFVFDVIANAFLYHMVRRLVSYQVAIGQGKVGVDDLSRLLDSRSHSLVQGLAPPQGLRLYEVHYPSEDIKQKSLDNN